MLTYHCDDWADKSSGSTRRTARSKPLRCFQDFLLFTVVTAIFFWQWIPHLHSALIGPPEDNQQDFWNAWYAAVARNPDHFFFTNLVRFPKEPRYITILLLTQKSLPSLCLRTSSAPTRHL